MSQSLIRFVVAASVILFLVTGCSTFVRIDKDKEQQFFEHLGMWEEFVIEGVVELSYEPLRFRKNIFIKSNDEQLNLTILDGGIFGLKPKPFLTAKIDTVLVIDAPDEVLALFKKENIGLKNLTLQDIRNGFTELKKVRGKAIRDKNVELETTKILFNDNMQITSIIVSGKSPSESTQKPLQISLQYKGNDQLSHIEMHNKGKLIMTITVDKMRASAQQT